jgi:hypothetical protein
VLVLLHSNEKKANDFDTDMNEYFPNLLYDLHRDLKYALDSNDMWIIRIYNSTINIKKKKINRSVVKTVTLNDVTSIHKTVG